MKTVCVLFGGVSSEHEVSLRSAESVLQNLDPGRYQVIRVGITKEGRWLRYRGPVEEIRSGGWERGDVTPALLSPDRGHGGLLELTPEGAKPVPVDVVFPVLHGRNGEDGTVQGLLTLAGIPFVGSGVLASAACMDKEIAHIVLTAAGVPKTDLIALTRSDTADFDALERRLRERLEYPMFVKPANAGSSVGVSKAKDPVELRDALSLAFSHDRKAVVERALTGQEIECAVLGNEAPVAAEVLAEIAPAGEFYDYGGKYLDDSAALHLPARIGDEAVIGRVREIAVRAYKAMGCRGLARVDFFVGEEGEITLNELNTIPGFTSISMYPKMFEAGGVSYPELLDRLIGYALGSGEAGPARSPVTEERLVHRFG